MAVLTSHLTVPAGGLDTIEVAVGGSASTSWPDGTRVGLLLQVGEQRGL